MTIRIELADDHSILRQGLRRILECHSHFQIVAEASSGLEAVQMADAHHPDVAVVDIGMKELNGIEATAQILRRSPETAVLILSMYGDERYVIRAMNAGARGYLLKDSVEEDLVRGIEQVHEGKSFFSPAVSKILSDSYARGRSKDVDDRYALLTERERQIYQLLAEGNSNKEVAGRLGVSLHTVETHRTRIMEKLGVHNAAELVLSAVRRGLIC
ncbi:MAG: response regulator transcription factor [Bryobacteraceae bacterium]